jgi:AcrR family transcriptional regulator
MEERDFSKRIKEIAVDLFDRDGYFGTPIRRIAGAAGCSLPMIYYYYKSKQELFHEIIQKDFFEMLSRQAVAAKGVNLVDFYTDFIFSLNGLSDYDRKVYRLGIKVYLGFDGDEALYAVMDEWERSIAARHEAIVLPRLKKPAEGQTIVRALVRLMENQIEAIVVKGRALPEPEIRAELTAILSGRTNDEDKKG